MGIMFDRLKKLFVSSEQDLTVRQRVRLAREHLDRGKLDEAYAEAQAAVQQGPDDASAHRVLGEVLLERRDLERARKALERARELDGELPDIHYLLGLVYTQRKELETAVRHYRSELSRNPQHGRVHANLAVALYSLKQPREALQHADRAKALGEELHPDFLEALKRYR